MWNKLFEMLALVHPHDLCLYTEKDFNIEKCFHGFYPNDPLFDSSVSGMSREEYKFSYTPNQCSLRPVFDFDIFVVCGFHAEKIPKEFRTERMNFIFKKREDKRKEEDLFNRHLEIENEHWGRLGAEIDDGIHEEFEKEYGYSIRDYYYYE